ncbi:MAG: DNA gyrase inhibitor YacG [Bacteriovoracaceae bacterium]|nr:DNA gyrase inhibitor YacG [Bacteriovoracaceae bacterium]
MTKKLEIDCPQCNEKFNYYASESRPFCSERCKMVDLGHWFTESYTVASNEALSEQDIDQVQEALEKDHES